MTPQHTRSLIAALLLLCSPVLWGQSTIDGGAADQTCKSHFPLANPATDESRETHRRQMKDCRVLFETFAPINKSGSRIGLISDMLAINEQGVANWETAAYPTTGMVRIAKRFETFATVIRSEGCASLADKGIKEHLLAWYENDKTIQNHDIKISLSNNATENFHWRVDNWAAPWCNTLTKLSNDYLTAVTAQPHPKAIYHDGKDVLTQEGFVDYVRDRLGTGLTGGDAEEHGYGLLNLIGFDYTIDSAQFDELIISIGYYIELHFNLITTTIRQYGRNILAIMLILAFFYAGYQLIIQGGDLQGFAKSLISIVVIGAIFLYLLSFRTEEYKDDDGVTQTREVVVFIQMMNGIFNWVTEAPRIALCDEKLLPKIKGNAPTVPSFCNNNTVHTDSAALGSAASMFTYGLKAAVSIIDLPDRTTAYMTSTNAQNSSFFGVTDTSWRVVQYVVGTFLGLIFGAAVAVLWILASLYFMVIWIEGFLIVMLGVFILGFGAHDWSRDKAVAYIWFCVGWGFRYAAALFVVFIVRSSFESALNDIPFFNSLISGQVMNISTFFLYGLVRILEPILIIMLVNSIANRIGQFFGNSSQAGNSLAGMMQRIGTSAASMAIAAPAVGMSVAKSGIMGAVKAGREGSSPLKAGGQSMKEAMGDKTETVRKQMGQSMVNKLMGKR